MNQLVFVIWEQNLAERFGTPLLERPRTRMERTSAHVSLSPRYSDAALVPVEEKAPGEGIRAAALPWFPASRRFCPRTGLTSRLGAARLYLPVVQAVSAVLLLLRRAYHPLGLPRTTPLT